MLQIKRSLLCLAMPLFFAAVTGCSSVSTVELTMNADTALNPDLNGRPSPLVVRLYELKSLSVFNNADFFNLFEQDVALLGDELQMRDEMAFQPGETKIFERDLRADTRYLGLIGAYRDIENARWRSSIEIDGDMELIIDLGAKGIDIKRED